MATIENMLDQDGALDAGKLCMVHRSYRPIPQNGELFATATMSDYTDRYGRGTLHFTMNHAIEDHHRGGVFMHAPYAVIGGFDDVRQANAEDGLPLSPRGLNTVDTFFTRGPGEALKIPDPIYVEPATVPTDALLTVDKNIIRYKTSGYTAEDIVQIRDQLRDAPVTRSVQDQQKLDERLDKAFLPLEHILDRYTPRKPGAHHWLIDDPMTKQSFDKALAEAPEGEKDKAILRYVKNHAINTGIKMKGFEVTRGGALGWEDSERVQQATEKLAEKLNEANRAIKPESLKNNNETKATPHYGTAYINLDLSMQYLHNTLTELADGKLTQSDLAKSENGRSVLAGSYYEKYITPHLKDVDDRTRQNIMIVIGRYAEGSLSQTQSVVKERNWTSIVEQNKTTGPRGV